MGVRAQLVNCVSGGGRYPSLSGVLGSKNLALFFGEPE